MASCNAFNLFEDRTDIESLIRYLRENKLYFGIIHSAANDEYIATVGSVTKKHRSLCVALASAAREYIVIRKWNTFLFSKETKKLLAKV